MSVRGADEEARLSAEMVENVAGEEDIPVAENPNKDLKTQGK